MRKILNTPGAVLQVDDAGEAGRGPALVLLHYWGGSSATWRKVIPLLSDAARCVAINQRGWGGSVATDGRYGLDALADDALAVLHDLGITRAVLAGHSMGGKVAQIVAARQPAALAGLVLVAPAPPTSMPVPEEVRAQMLASYGSAAGVEQALAMLAGPSLPAADRMGIVADTLAGDPAAKREWTERGMVADLAIAPGSITVPVTVLVGSADRVEAPARLRAIYAELVPQAQVLELEGVGHLSPLEAPNAIADACRRMLAQVTAD